MQGGNECYTCDYAHRHVAWNKKKADWNGQRDDVCAFTHDFALILFVQNGAILDVEIYILEFHVFTVEFARLQVGFKMLQVGFAKFFIEFTELRVSFAGLHATFAKFLVEFAENRVG